LRVGLTIAGAVCPVSAHVLRFSLLTALRRASLDILVMALLFSLLDVSIEDDECFLSKLERESF
jgi:hypothetical protein